MPSGYCQCKCGGLTRIATKTDMRQGCVKGEPLRFIKGHQTRGRVYPKRRIDPGSHKTCTKCGKSQVIDQFGKRKDKVDGRESWCRSCQRKLSRAYSVKVKYGIEYDEYLRRCELQEYRCGICSKLCEGFDGPTHTKGARRHTLAVDHCHRSNRIRGLLCMDCNMALGHFGDTKVLLKKALEYLEEGECEK